MKKAYPYIIIALLAIIAIILIVTKHPATVTSNPTQSTTPVSTVSPAVPIKPISTISVPGMTEYTDSSFGFSFWYPSTWTVTTPDKPPFGVQLQHVSVVATLGLQPAGQTYPSIQIKEAHSTTRTITDTGGAGPIGPITFFFDTTTHLWMTTSAIETGTTDITKSANISINTMGGLHMFGGTSRFDTTIIPLSADNFVVVDDGGAVNATALAKTVVASDPTVATPVSTADQIKVIQAEKDAYSKNLN